MNCIVYVECVIRRIKVFKILCYIVFVLLVKKVDDILIVCFVLFNLGFDLIKYQQSNVDFDDKEYQYIDDLIGCYIF